MSIPFAACFLALLFLRPTILGQNYTVVGLALLLLGSIAALLIKSSKKQKLSQADAITFTLAILVWIYIWTSGVFLDSDKEFLTKSVVANLAAILFAFSLVRLRDFYPIFERMSVKIMATLGWLGLISYIAALFIGIESTHLLDIQVEEHRRPIRLIAPLGFVYADYQTATESFYWRLSAIFRESGIAQGFYIWTLSLSLIRGHKKWITGGSLTGVIMCFSTIGIGLLVIVLSYFIFIRSDRYRKSIRVIGIPLLPVVGFAALYYAPGIGIASKAQTHQASLLYRTDAIFNADFSNIITGAGMYSGNLTGGSLLAQIPAIGAIGFTLTMAFYLYALMRYTPHLHQLDKFAVVGPIIITCLVTQPLLDAPFLWMLILLTVCGKRDVVTNQRYSEY